MALEFAVNYSEALAALMRDGLVDVDRVKCPAWPDLIDSLWGTIPLYVHFPLMVGAGIGDAKDWECGGPADWDKVESLLSKTGTEMVNVHLTPGPTDCPDVPQDSTEPHHVELMIERALADVGSVVKCFGAERVLVENGYGTRGRILQAACVPEAICRVVEESGCSLLLDLSHARLAALESEMTLQEYLGGLPLDRTVEIHITGIRCIDENWIDRARRAGEELGFFEPFVGYPVDHLPMTDEDWVVTAWAMDQVHNGLWGEPSLAAYEYGGVGGLFAAFTVSEILAEQVPRLGALVRGE